MTREAYDLSERTGLPVMVRLVTRLSHSRGSVETSEPRPQNALRLGDRTRWTLLPSNARVLYQSVLDRQAGLLSCSESSSFNRLEAGTAGERLGVIASGIGYNYVRECLAAGLGAPRILKISVSPWPERLIRDLVATADTVLVVEEGFPLIERALKGMYGVPGKTIIGKLSGHLPLAGELTPETVRRALGGEALERRPIVDFPLASRPPQLCAGCPHGDTLKAVTEAIRGAADAAVFSDIGCYTLGYFDPYRAVDTCVCMGASIGMAKGASEAGVHPAIAVIGDSTFGHSGITPLLSAAAADTDMVVVVLDNGTVAMTGGQSSFASGERLLRLVEGVGVAKEHIRTISPLPKFHALNTAVFKEEIAHKGLSVVVAVRECLEETKKRTRREP